MQRLQAFKYELRPNGEQKRNMGCFAGSRTSSTCPLCDHVAAENRRTQAQFECVNCGNEQNADVVGAINVLARGHRVAACGEEGSGSGRRTRTKPASVKQEPTEVTTDEHAHA
jgi:putative transposase